MIRTLLFALALVVSTSACAKKKSPASPANAAPDPASESGGGEGSEVNDETKPDDPDDAGRLGADPCDGGE